MLLGPTQPSWCHHGNARVCLHLEFTFEVYYRLWAITSDMDIQPFQFLIHNFKDYAPFIVFIKYWLYSQYCTMYPCGFFIPNRLCLLISYPYIAPPPSLSPLVATSLFSVSVSLCLFCYMHYLVVFFRFISHISDITHYLSSLLISFSIIYS